MTPSPPARFAALLVPGRGVQRIPRLEAFLPEAARIDRVSAPRPDTDGVVGWGLKASAARARAIAARHRLPFIALEDGFLRSIGLGEAGAPPLGLIVDDLGVHYDARRPSQLEAMLEQGGWETSDLIARARGAIARLIETGIAKTNSTPPLDPALLRPVRRRILVVDQTAGDLSIAGGLADESSFVAMLDAARADEPDAEIVVRRHPAVASGLKQGCIPTSALRGVTLLDADARAADILARVDAVYTVSSGMGFEALIRGLPVRCFGMPFYAGWGATADALAVPRRTRRRSVEELFAAAYILCSRYVDPIRDEPTTIEDTIERLVEWRAAADASAGHIAAVGFRPWKRAATRTILAGPHASMSFHGDVPAAIAAACRRHGSVMIWSGRESRAMTDQLDAAPVPVLRMEDGFLRSRGLGSDFHLPGSVVLDDRGIYYDPSRPSRLELILDTADMPAPLLARAAALRRTLVAAGLSKYNVGRQRSFADARGRFRLLVVGQVEDDRSIERGTAAVRTNLGLIEAARALHPDAHLIYKPHPDVESGNRIGAIPPGTLAGLADEIADDADIAQCLAHADGLATMTSAAGFEALLRGLPVWTWGGPFYAGWGLTTDHMPLPRRTRRLTLDQLVAGTLILYPRYVYPPTGLPCRPEELADWLAGPAPPAGHRRLRWARAVIEALKPPKPVRY